MPTFVHSVSYYGRSLIHWYGPNLHSQISILGDLHGILCLRMPIQASYKIRLTRVVTSLVQTVKQKNTDLFPVYV